MAISAQHIVAFTRHRVSAPSLVCWAALRGGLARLLPALLALWTRLPAFLQFVSVPALESESRNPAGKSDALKAAAEDDGEGKVLCEMLYCPPPELWEVDVIFIHGLHGSTVKTWRQGDWHSKYREVQKVSLRKHPPEAEQTEDICASCHLSIRKPKRTMSAPNTCGKSDINTSTNCQTDRSPGKRRKTGQNTSKKCTQNQNVGQSARADKRKSPCHKESPNKTHRTRAASKITKETFDKCEESSDSDDGVLYFNVTEKHDAENENDNKKLTEDIEQLDNRDVEVNLDIKRVPLELSVKNSYDLAVGCNNNNLSEETDKTTVELTKVGDYLVKETKDGQTTAVPRNLIENSKSSDYIKIDCDASAIICDNSFKKDVLIAGYIKHDGEVSGFTDCDKNTLGLADTIHPMERTYCDNCARKNTINNLGSSKCEDCSAVRELVKIDFKETVVEPCTKDELLFYIDLDSANHDFSESNSSQGDDYIPRSNCMKRRHDASKLLMKVNLRTDKIFVDNEASKVRKLNDDASETKSCSSNKSSFDEYMELDNEFFNVNSEYNQFQFDGSIESREKERIANEELDQLTYDFLKQYQYFNDDSDGLDAPYEVSDESYIKTAVSEPNFLHDRPKDEMLQNLDDGRIEFINLTDSSCSKSESSLFESGNENDDFSSSDLESRFECGFCNCGPEKKNEKLVKSEGKLEEMLSSCWPRDWIPMDHPGARVISLSYTTDQYLWRPIWIKPYNRSSLHERSEDMIRQLSAHGAGSRPIVWVGHSKGGLFIKQMFSDGYESWSTLGPSSAGARIYLSSRALVFYSVPHRGSPLANIKLPFLLRVSSELEEIQHESDFVLRLHERFLGAVRGGAEPPVVLSYSETRRTLMGAIYLRIVPLQSADPGVGSVFGVSLDHREICKPTSRSCFLYRELLGVIQSTGHSSP